MKIKEDYDYVSSTHKHYKGGRYPKKKNPKDPKEQNDKEVPPPSQTDQHDEKGHIDQLV
ncbi:MAG: hypothetical protein IEMM0008_1841 [bacterium]|nr:MAG: hypothetical protein IEMM0008_1841 [bacterium]